MNSVSSFGFVLDLFVFFLCTAVSIATFVFIFDFYLLLCFLCIIKFAKTPCLMSRVPTNFTGGEREREREWEGVIMCG